MHLQTTGDLQQDIVTIEYNGFLLDRSVSAIEDEIEEAPTLYTIDVVDFARAHEQFRRVAQTRIPL